MEQIVLILKPFAINVGIDFEQEINFKDPLTNIDPKLKNTLK